MKDNVRQTLREIGRQLDSNVFPRVKNGGIVVPSEPPSHSQILGVEMNHAEVSKRRPAARSRPRPSGRQRPAGRSRPAGGSRTPGDAASVVRTDLQNDQHAQVAALQEAYPLVQAWPKEGGLWLLTRSELLDGADVNALFVTAVWYERLSTNDNMRSPGATSRMNS